MWWTKFIQKLFLLENEPKKEEPKSLKDLTILDTVWIKDEGILYEGWVFDITRRCIIVVYGPDLRDFRFRIDKGFNKQTITQNDKSLFCNDPGDSYIAISK